MKQSVTNFFHTAISVSGIPSGQKSHCAANGKNRHMKRSITGIIIMFIVFAFVGTGCKKFLNVQSVSALSGNAFFKTPKDFEQYISGIYGQFRAYTMGDDPNTYNAQFFPATGDFRCAPYTGANNAERGYINLLATNNLLVLTTSYDATYWDHAYSKITDWGTFFQIIASCNIMADAVDKSGGILNETQKGQYKGEAVFMRNLCYFFMARLYGDIPYYTDAYHSDPLTRQNMISVLQKCVADMATAVNGLPWTYDDPSKRAVRAMKGSALDLMMNMDMWCAGFDAANQQTYWQQTDSLGNVLLTQNGGAYELYPMDQFHTVFEGGSKEGLFEIEQSINLGELFSLFSSYADNVLTSPYKYARSETYARFNLNYLKLLYLNGSVPDLRWTTFFKQIDPSDPATLNYLKFTDIFRAAGEDYNPDDNQIIFRLPDAILLRAEACANLGKNDDAIQMLDMVRERAGAPDYKDGEVQTKNLPDAIYIERCKELMGEGYYFYDLVRTGKILDPNYCAYPLTRAAFNAGAWTWPLSENVRTQNPGVTLNAYWSQ